MIGWVQKLSMTTHFLLAAALRLALIAYGLHQDNSMELKYTDIDYHVYTDAARYVYEGYSPYSRHTYRYTPILAYLMIPNVIFSSVIGKFIFCAFDIVSGALIYSILRRDGVTSVGTAKIAAAAWLHNPVVMNVSTRGSAESLIVCLVLLTVHLYHQKVFVLTGIAYGLAIHLKLYPVIYCLTLYLPLTSNTGWRSLFQMTTARVRLVLSTMVTLTCLTYLFYCLYGHTFIQETYLYHFTRKDIRHNFSVYFYLLYLTVEEDDIGLNLVTFLPQLILMAAVSFRFSNIYEVNFSLFCQTVIFVTFNKVVTAQYFLWYLCLLPIVAPKLNLTRKDVVVSTALWAFAVGSWLLPAYLLEFKGINTFLFIWLESLAFFCANVGLLAKAIRRHRELCTHIEDMCNVQKMD